MEEPTPPASDRFARQLPPEMHTAFQTLLLIGGMAARALWRDAPETVPPLLPVVAAVEHLTGLTAADGALLYACSASADDTVREALLRPGRFYLFIALGMATYDSALVGSPLLPAAPSAEHLATAHQMAAALFAMIERTASGEVTDMPLDFDPFRFHANPFQASAEEMAAAAQAADEANATPRMVEVYTTDELRLKRLQLDTLFGHHAPALAAVAMADRLRYAPDTALADDPADDPARAGFYHAPRFKIGINFLHRGLLALSVGTATRWYEAAAVPFAYAAANLHWVRRGAALRALLKRLENFDFDDLGATPLQVYFSLAEVLALYQAQESVALAVLNDGVMAAVVAVMPPEPMLADDAVPLQNGGGMLQNHFDWVRHELQAGADLGQSFLRFTTRLIELLAGYFTDAEAAEFAAARAEVAALAELATSGKGT